LVLLIGNEAWLIGKSFVNRPATAQAATASANVNHDLVERIVAAQLFGRPAAQASNQAPPTTDLQLILRGVFTAQDPHSASAMIETSDGHVQIIKTGANVATDTVLQQVFSNHIVLARNGALESLYFPTSADSADAVALAQNNTASGTESSRTDSNTDNDANAGASPEELKRAAILRRLEELRARSSH
jgi:general secretion pathway protein C